MAIFLQGFFSNLELYWQKIWDRMPVFVFALILFLIFLFLSRVEKRIFKRIINRLEDKSKIEALLLLDRVIRIFVLSVGLIISLALVGVNLTALITGFGIFGFIIGFAVRDLVSNFFAGLIILLEKPVEIGDYIEIDGKYGIIISIDIRDTILLQNDERRIIVPNAELLTKVIIRGKKKDE